MKLYLFLPCLLLGACVSTPPSITDTHVVDVSYSEASQNIDSYKGDLVRWGGVITDVEYEEDFNLIEVYFRPLAGSGRPHTLRYKSVEGPFVIKPAYPIDPETLYIFSEIAVVGTLDGDIKRTVDGKEVSVPLIVVNDPQNLYTWEKDYPRGGLGAIDSSLDIKHDDPPGKKTSLLLGNVVVTILAIPICLVFVPCLEVLFDSVTETGRHYTGRK